MQLRRERNFSIERFLEEYLAPNEPLIVADAIERWPSPALWNESWLRRQFGRSQVQVYDELFNLAGVRPLQQYLDREWKNPPESGPVPYVRWYAKFKPVDFVWADAAFAKFASHWCLPYFLPVSDYLLPRCPQPQQVTPVSDAFPARGLFISAVGSRTRWHVDPWCSDAILCQLAGRKKFALIGPRKSVEVSDVLAPGEILYIPAGWRHDFLTVENSISLTWNFVHAVSRDRFEHYLATQATEQDKQVLRYFNSVS
jgi:cupin superfamily protein